MLASIDSPLTIGAIGPSNHGLPHSLHYYPVQAFKPLTQPRTTQCIIRSAAGNSKDTAASSTNTKPRTWDRSLVELVNCNKDYTGKKHMEEVQKMVDYARNLLDKQMDPLEKIELIDAIQRLGLEYHFEREIKHSLKSLYESAATGWPEYDDLHSTALRFRIFRQHHYYEVPQDVFQKFIDETGEDIMDKAEAFSVEHLKEKKRLITSPSLAREVEHALDMPILWRPNRLEARWFMGAYEEQPDMNRTLLNLAKFDYNIVQSVHREEYGRLERWWTELGLGKMTFSRDNLVEHYLWTAFMVFDPKYKDLREMTTKVIAMITLIDDIYDSLGTLEELELLTRLIDRWDVNGIDELPPNIATCFIALYNVTNGIGFWAMITRGINVIPYIRKTWSDQCMAYLKEAKWCHKDSMPTLKEYLNNAVRSVGGFLALQCCFFITSDNLTEDTLNYMAEIPRIVRCSSLLIRLNNDLAPLSVGLAEGDKLNSLECFMNETGASEEEARKHIKYLVRETWKTLNKDIFDDNCRFSGPFVTACLNLARASHWIYRYGDGHGIRSEEAKEHLISALVDPVPIMQLGLN
ncbi:monoterpene synthase-like isoform X2 [Punica granatum]|uniref:Monoterpene synthase-like isoform X2 n=1 Tax=Punica granatum TaxID=22663 RepID=A0A6P8DDR4_PUNGR|nr:monoterpene synthase-like isoform X2 [Punica granatum]